MTPPTSDALQQKQLESQQPGDEKSGQIRLCEWKRRPERMLANLKELLLTYAFGVLLRQHEGPVEEKIVVSDTVEQFDKMRLAPGWISKEDLDLLRRKTGHGLQSTLLDLLSVARRFSNPEISNFQVGAAAVGASGAVYFGANQEFARSDVTQTIHAEQAAILNAYERKEKAITILAVSAEPCGFCRQFLNELNNAMQLEILMPSKHGPHKIGLSELLPHAFGPGNLGIEGALFSIQDHGLKVDFECDDVCDAALTAANRSYAAYTHAFAGVGIRTRGGRCFSGSYIENAAFNPSVPPLLAAIVSAAMHGVPTNQVSDIVLVQRQDSKIDHSGACRAIVDTFIDASFRVCGSAYCT